MNAPRAMGWILVGLLAWPLAATADVLRFMHTDLQGSVVAVTDESGAIIERRVYEPYGLPTAPIADGPGYTGHDMDGETGLVYMQQRYYDPEIGRFLSIDPVGVNTTSGGNFNRYWYANDNPYKYVDPDGRIGVIGAVIGGGIELGTQYFAEGRSLSDVDWSDVGVAAAVGAVTGGIASKFAVNAAKGVITAKVAVRQTAIAAGATSANGSMAQDVLNGEQVSAGDALLSGAVGTVTSAIGAKIGNSAAAKLDELSSSRSPGARNIAENSRPLLAGESAETFTTTSQKSGQVAVDAIGAQAQNQLKEEFRR